MVEINENYPEDLYDLIINEVELENPIGFNYTDENLEKKFEELKKKLNIKKIYVGQSEDYEDTQFADSYYIYPIEITYFDDSIENYYVRCNTYGDHTYDLISEKEDPELYNEYTQLIDDWNSQFDENCEDQYEKANNALEIELGKNIEE